MQWKHLPTSFLIAQSRKVDKTKVTVWGLLELYRSDCSRSETVIGWCFLENLVSQSRYKFRVLLTILGWCVMINWFSKIAH